MFAKFVNFVLQKKTIVICYKMYFFCRIVDKGGVGDKFFEGMINMNYLKKIKKRLLETTEYFEIKGESDMDNGKPITDERRVFYFSTAKYVVPKYSKHIKICFFLFPDI